MRKILETIDATEVKPNFFISGRDTYPTLVGGVLSLVNILLLILIIFAFGRNFFERTNPTMIQNQIYPSQYPNYTLGVTNNLSFAIRLEDLDTKVINRTDLVYIDFIYYHYEIINGEWELVNEKLLDYDYCKPKNFKKPELYERLGLHSSFCPDLNGLEVGGFWDESYIKFIRAFVRPCREGKVNNRGKKCGLDSEFKEILKNRLFISSFYQEYFVNSENYEKPMDIVYSNHFFMADPLILKRGAYFFRKGEITSDYGWILKDESSYSEMTLDKIVTDTLSISQLPPDKQNILGEVYIYFARKQEKFIRVYEKIQNLAADVGGIIKIFYTVNALFSFFISRQMMTFDLLNFIKSYVQDPDLNNNYFSNYCTKDKNSTVFNKEENPSNNDVNKRVINNYTGNKRDNKISRNETTIKDELHSINNFIPSRNITTINFLSQNTSKSKSKFLISKNFNSKNYVKRAFCCKNKYENEFKFLEDFYKKLLDIKNYFIINKELDSMKTILLSEFEKLSIPYVKWQIDNDNKINDKNFFKILNEKKINFDTLEEREKNLVKILN
jgi:hypothetical protein